MLLNSARQDLNAGKSPDDVAAAYASRLASLGLNPEEKAVLRKTLGEDIFSVPVQPVSIQDTAVELYNAQSSQFRLGLLQVVLQEAKAEGETLTDEQATINAVNLFASNSAQAQASLVAGNLNYSDGFSGNMETLQRFGTVVSAMLSVETRGDNFNIEEMLATMATFEQIKAQPAFMKPSGGASGELWAQMETQINAIDRLFVVLQGYDDRVVSAKATALTANLILGLAEENPLVAMAATNPDIMNKIAAELAPDFAKALSKDNAAILNKVVSFSDLEFDPSLAAFITNMLNSDPAGSETLTSLQSSETVFPTNLVESHTETVAEPATLTKAIGQLRQLTDAMSTKPDLVLANPESREAWVSSVANMAYLLSQVPNPSTQNLDSLFSKNNLTILRKMEAEGGEASEQPTILRQQMAQSLRTSSKKYAITATGQIQQLPDVSINPETLTIELDDVEVYQGINAVVELYYGGDFTKLWKEGTSAWDKLRNRLAGSGAIAVDTPEYATFLASTKAIDPSDAESLIWRGLAPKYTQFSGVTDRLQKFRQYEENLNIDTGFQTIIDSASRALDQSGTPEDIQARIDAGNIITSAIPPAETSLGEKLGQTEATPYTIKTQEEFDNLPAGTWYTNPSNGLSYQKLSGGE